MPIKYYLVVMKQREIETKSPEETEQYASVLANRLRGGEVIELVSDLGGGKTTFTRGLVAGLGSTEAVASPTFTLSREYSQGRLHVYHFDFYRLHEAGIMADELSEVVGDTGGVVVVEWADVLQQVLPERRLQVRIAATSENGRALHINYPDELAYLVEDV